MGFIKVWQKSVLYNGPKVTKESYDIKNRQSYLLKLVRLDFTSLKWSVHKKASQIQIERLKLFWSILYSE